MSLLAKTKELSLASRPKPLLTPLCRIDTDEDQWIRKFDVNDLITLWFYEGRDSIISGNRCVSWAHKLVRAAAEQAFARWSRPSGPGSSRRVGPPARRARRAGRHAPSHH